MDVNNSGNIAGVLLYAKTMKDNLHDNGKIMIGNNLIGVKTLDLNRDFKDIAQQLDEIIMQYL